MTCCGAYQIEASIPVSQLHVSCSLICRSHRSGMLYSLSRITECAVRCAVVKMVRKIWLVSSCVKSVVVVLLVTELSFSVSRRYLCDALCACADSRKQQSYVGDLVRGGAAYHLHCDRGCASYKTNPGPNGTGRWCCDLLLEGRAPLSTAVYPVHSTCSSPLYPGLCPCSVEIVLLEKPCLKYGLDSVCYWLCSESDVALPLPLLVLSADVTMCWLYSCALSTVLQLLTGLLVLSSNAKLQAVLLATINNTLSLEWASYYVDAISTVISPATAFYLPLLLATLILRVLLWSVNSDLSSNADGLHEPRSAQTSECASVVERLQQLSIGSTDSVGVCCSWLRRAEELDLLSSPVPPRVSAALVCAACADPTSHSLQQPSLPVPAFTFAGSAVFPVATPSHPTSLTNSLQSSISQHSVLWPARLQQPRSSLASATAALSLTD